MSHNGNIEIKEIRQRKRLFQRLVTGFYYRRKEEFRFLTVTSAPDSPDLATSWKNFVKQVRNNYGKFEYFAVFTNEGHGVIHCVFVGSYIPFDWIQQRWKHIHGAYFVNIQSVNRYDPKKRKKKGGRPKKDDAVYYPAGLAKYVLTQYVKDQNAIRTINFSRSWVYPGFVHDWERVKKQTKDKKKRIAIWHKYLDDMRYKQQELNITITNNDYAR